MSSNTNPNNKVPPGDSQANTSTRNGDAASVTENSTNVLANASGTPKAPTTGGPKDPTSTTPADSNDHTPRTSTTKTTPVARAKTTPAQTWQLNVPRQKQQLPGFTSAAKQLAKSTATLVPPSATKPLAKASSSSGSPINKPGAQAPDKQLPPPPIGISKPVAPAQQPPEQQPPEPQEQEKEIVVIDDADIENNEMTDTMLLQGLPMEEKYAVPELLYKFAPENNLETNPTMKAVLDKTLDFEEATETLIPKEALRTELLAIQESMLECSKAYDKHAKSLAKSDGKPDFVHKSVRVKAVIEVPYGSKDFPDLQAIYEGIHSDMCTMNDEYRRRGSALPTQSLRVTAFQFQFQLRIERAKLLYNQLATRMIQFHIGTIPSMRKL